MTQPSTGNAGPYRLDLSREAVVAPGVFDGLSACLVRQAGYPAVYASGGAISRVLGYPDIGLISLAEMVSTLRNIVDAARLPVIADADDGYGGPLCAWRTARAYAQLGIAALHIEDQASPKKCGHLSGKRLVETSQMVEKLLAAKEAAAGTGMRIIARTDAIAVEGFDAALKRAERYAAAGADMLFVEAPETVEQIRIVAETISQPKVINMFPGGKTPLMDQKDLFELGYSLVIIPSNLQRAVIGCMQAMLGHMKNGDTAAIAAMLPPINVRDLAVDMDDYVERETRVAETAKALR